jgi:hypothetical protein
MRQRGHRCATISFIADGVFLTIDLRLLLIAPPNQSYALPLAAPPLMLYSGRLHEPSNS